MVDEDRVPTHGDGLAAALRKERRREDARMLGEQMTLRSGKLHA
jgi:hypothetical protein